MIVTIPVFKIKIYTSANKQVKSACKYFIHNFYIYEKLFIANDYVTKSRNK
jgi:NADH:ubiquinone oxidoreductase subunit 3 (subunit A)